MVVHDFPVRIYYDDTDAGGVVYHANYLKLCERARTESLRTMGFENTKIREEHGAIIVVKSLEAEYLSPSKLDDLLTIQSRVLSVKNTSFVMEQKAIRNNICIFSMNIVLVFVKAGEKSSGRPTKIPDDVKVALANGL